MPTVDVSAAVTLLGTRVLTVTHRATQSVNAAGEVVEGSTSTESIKGSWQPIGREVQELAEGERISDTAWLFTTSVLNPRAGESPGDTVDVTGKGIYEVVRVDDWQEIAGYSRYLLERLP